MESPLPVSVRWGEADVHRSQALGIATAATLASPGLGFVDLVVQPPRFIVGAAKRENVIRSGPARAGNRIGWALLPGLAINRLALLGHEAPSLRHRSSHARLRTGEWLINTVPAATSDIDLLDDTGPMRRRNPPGRRATIDHGSASLSEPIYSSDGRYLAAQVFIAWPRSSHKVGTAAG